MVKNFLPLKTKIAAWWMIISTWTIGVLVIKHLHLTYLLLCYPLCGSFFAFFTLRRRKWAYLGIIVILIFGLGLLIFPQLSLLIFLLLLQPTYYMGGTPVFTASEVLIPVSLIFLSLLIPLILLLLDRKNFFKIAS